MKHKTLLDNTDLNKLVNFVEGKVITPNDTAYTAARQVWNGLYDKYPAVIVKCANASDVKAAISYAKAHNLPLAVRGGGHDYAGNSVLDNGLVIDLSLMNSVHIDPDAKTAVVQGGATIGEFDDKAQEHGLATTTGTVSSIGVAGLTLGGGTGYLARKHGLTIDNLLEVDIITADGNLVTASNTENEELFWGLRGGGGNFGVGVSFKFQLHKVGPEVLSFQAFHPYEDCRKVFAYYREFMVKAPRELQCYAFILHTPPVAPFPEEYHGKPTCALIACYAGDLEKGKSVIKPLEEFGKPFLKFSQPTAYTEMQKSFDAGTPKGLRWYSKAHYIPELNDAIIDTLEHFTQPLPGPYTMVYFEPTGGTINEKDPTVTAFPHRNAAFSMHILPGWDDKEQDVVIIKWAKEFHKQIEQYATGGVYVNLMSHDEENRVKPAAYGQNYERLLAIKQKWDPDNLFSGNHNVKP